MREIKRERPIYVSSKCGRTIVEIVSSVLGTYSKELGWKQRQTNQVRINAVLTLSVRFE